MVNSDDAVLDGTGGDGGECQSSGEVSCSICLDDVADNGSRSWAKLHCGHQFHLDCIGSAFNVKGAMQCPNCRKIEKGQWLFANGSRSYPEWSMDDLNIDGDHYDFSVSELSVGLHWCPFCQLARTFSLFDNGEYSLPAYLDTLGQHAVLSEHTAVSAASHFCPYVAYIRSVSSLGHSSGSVSDGSNSNSLWNGSTIANEMPTSYAFFPTIDVNYNGWEHRRPPFLTRNSNVSAADQPLLPLFPQMSARASSDINRPGSYLQPPLVDYSSVGRAGSSVASSMVPPYLGSNAGTQDRFQAHQAYYHPQPTDSSATQDPIISSTRRAYSHRGWGLSGSTVLSTDHTGGFFIYPLTTGHNFQGPDNPQPLYYHPWEIDQAPPFSSNETDRDRHWGSFYQFPPLSSPAIRFSSFQQRHGSERTS